MGVYVTLCIKRGERAARTSALVNSGYEAEEPELHRLRSDVKLGAEATRALERAEAVLQAV